MIKGAIIGCGCFNRLPTPIGGIIYLEDKVYDLQLETITTSSSIRFPEDANCKLTNGTIIYTGSGTLFDTPAMGSLVKRISDVFAINTGSGTLFNTTTVIPSGALVIDNFAALDFDSIGSVTGGLFSITASRSLDIGTGITLTDLSLTNIAGWLITGTNQTTTFIDWTGTTQGDIDIVSYAPTIQGNENAINFDSTTTFNNVTAHGCTIGLSGTATVNNVFESGSLDQTEIGFKFTGNTNISDSTVTSQIGFQNNSTIETVIDEKSVPVRVNGVFVNGFEERTTHTSDGIVTYIGKENISVSARGHISLEPVTGINIIMGGYVAKLESEIFEVTFTNGTDVVNRTDHGLSNGTSLQFESSGTLPAEIRNDHFYWVVNATTNTFQISRTEGGSVYTFTDDGSGTHVYSLGQYYESSEVTDATSTNSPGNIVIESLLNLSTGDRAFAMVDNHDTTSNILVTSINIPLTKV